MPDSRALPADTHAALIENVREKANQLDAHVPHDYGEPYVTVSLSEIESTIAAIRRLADALESSTHPDGKDTERLDWLIDQGHVIELHCYADGVWAFGDINEQEGVEGATARDAIDKAISNA